MKPTAVEYVGVVARGTVKPNVTNVCVLLGFPLKPNRQWRSSKRHTHIGSIQITLVESWPRHWLVRFSMDCDVLESPFFFGC